MDSQTCGNAILTYPLSISQSFSRMLIPLAVGHTFCIAKKITYKIHLKTAAMMLVTT